MGSGGETGGWGQAVEVVDSPVLSFPSSRSFGLPDEISFEQATGKRYALHVQDEEAGLQLAFIHGALFLLELSSSRSLTSLTLSFLYSVQPSYLQITSLLRRTPL